MRVFGNRREGEHLLSLAGHVVGTNASLAEAEKKDAYAGAYLHASFRDVYCGGHGKLLLLCHALREIVAQT